MDNYFTFLQNISGSDDLTEKMKTYTEQNISASTEYLHKLSQAKSFPEVFQIQTEFMQTQWNSFTEQARSIGEAYTKAVTGAHRINPFAMSLEQRVASRELVSGLWLTLPRAKWLPVSSP